MSWVVDGLSDGSADPSRRVWGLVGITVNLLRVARHPLGGVFPRLPQVVWILLGLLTGAVMVFWSSEWSVAETSVWYLLLAPPIVALAVGAEWVLLRRQGPLTDVWWAALLPGGLLGLGILSVIVNGDRDGTGIPLQVAALFAAVLAIGCVAVVADERRRRTGRSGTG